MSERGVTDGSQDAQALAGAWSDLDWEQMARELDRNRHNIPPSLPLDLSNDT